MSKAKKIFLILVVVIVLAIVAVIAATSQSGPVLQPQPQYSEEQASERLETLKEAQNTHVVEVVPMKFFVEEFREDVGTFTLSAVTTMSPDDIAAVSFRATTSADPSVEKWYTARAKGGGRYQLSGTASDLGGGSGTYTIEAFITPVGGGESAAGETQIDMKLSNYFYTEAVGEGKQSLVLAGPSADLDKEITGVRFKVWSVDGDQDDLKTYDAEEQSEGVWTAEIDVHEFSGKGDFIANAYAVFAEEDDAPAAAGNTGKTADGKTAEKNEKSGTGVSAETAAGENGTSVEEATGENGTAAGGTAGQNGTSVEDAAEKAQGTGEGEEREQEEFPGTEIGIASERFELLPDPMNLPNGAGEIVTEGKRVYVKVPELLQMPELPTGCESVALTIALESYGFELEKTDIAKKYLAFGTDMAISYVGDPFSKNGAGCFPPAIVDAADKYLEEQKDNRTGHNITGTSIDDLCEYIDNGIPVILWTSMYMADPTKTNSVYTYQGQTYQWYRSEHCVTLYGYDKEKDVYLVSDPLNGFVERDASAFRNIYDSIGKYAVVIY